MIASNEASFMARKVFHFSGGSREREESAPHRASKFCPFHAVFGKIEQIRVLAPPPPGGLEAPPWGNPGSATEFLECVTLPWLIR